VKLLSSYLVQPPAFSHRSFYNIRSIPSQFGILSIERVGPDHRLEPVHLAVVPKTYQLRVFFGKAGGHGGSFLEVVARSVHLYISRIYGLYGGFSVFRHDGGDGAESVADVEEADPVHAQVPVDDTASARKVVAGGSLRCAQDDPVAEHVEAVFADRDPELS